MSNNVNEFSVDRVQAIFAAGEKFEAAGKSVKAGAAGFDDVAKDSKASLLMTTGAKQVDAAQEIAAVFNEIAEKFATLGTHYQAVGSALGE